MKLMRKVHLYLGCIFAPLLILFIFSGAIQTFGLHFNQTDGSKSNEIISQASIIHTGAGKGKYSTSLIFRFYVLFMCIGLFISVILGIIMAFKYERNPVIVWLCLLMGIAIPVLLIWISRVTY